MCSVEQLQRSYPKCHCGGIATTLGVGGIVIYTVILAGILPRFSASEWQSDAFVWLLAVALLSIVSFCFGGMVVAIRRMCQSTPAQRKEQMDAWNIIGASCPDDQEGHEKFLKALETRGVDVTDRLARLYSTPSK